MHLRRLYVESANIDAVKAQHRRATRKALGESAGSAAKRLDQAKASDQQELCPVAPVVEIAGDDQGCIARSKLLHAFGKRFHLPSPATRHQAEMNTHTMQHLPTRWELDLTVEQATTLETVIRDILVVLGQDGKPAQYCVAVVAMVVNRVLAIGGLMPDFLGKKLVLRISRPVCMSYFVADMHALDFLQKHQVDIQRTQPVAQVMDHHASIELGKSLMDVVGADLELHIRTPQTWPGSTPAIIMLHRFMYAKSQMNRMQVVYRVSSRASEIEARAQAIAVEQSIEMPPHAVRNHRVSAEVLGKVEGITADGPNHFLVTLSLALETTGFEAGQMMNMLFGNSSLHTDLSLVDVDLEAQAAARFGGPRFGMAGLRQLLGAGERPLTCTALKPQGSTIEELAHLAHTFAEAGIDIIKDDHGLADQHTTPFAERVVAVQQAVDAANRATGRRTLYAPSLTGGPARQRTHLMLAKEAGIGALLIAPMISGCSALQELADEGVPILAHPALAGAARISPALLMGKLFRLFGADAVIYPNHGGRFSFAPALCREIAETARNAWAGLAACVPVPAGGMHPDRVEELVDFYGRDVMLLIGGALLEADDIRAATRAFVQRVARCEYQD